MTTQVGYGPLERIDGPPPLRPLFGLLQAAEAPAGGVRIVPDVDADGVERWINGAEVYPYPPETGDVHDPCALPSNVHDKDFGDETISLPDFGAMTVVVPVTCTTYRVWSQEEYKARAVEAFLAVEGSIVAREFMGGLRLPLNPHLADGEGTFPNLNAPTSPRNGLALLEEVIALSGRQGVIHCSPMLATTLMGSGFALSDKTGVIRTINGIVVIPDFGYAQAKASPVGHPDATTTEEWIYATGPVDVRRGDVFVMPETTAEAVERGTGGASTGRPNSVTYRVERYYLVTWDTQVQGAVLVDRCQTTC